MIIILAQAASVTPDAVAAASDYREFVYGAAAVALGGVLQILGGLVVALVTHRREDKREKKKHIDDLLRLAQESFRRCQTYRGEMTRRIIARQELQPVAAATLADDAQRIAL